MNLSDKILEEESLISYAKTIDPIYYQDHFNTAWLKFRQKEIEVHGFQEKMQYSYKSYFTTIIKNTYLDSCKKNKVYYRDVLPDIKSVDVNYNKIQDFFDKEEDKLLRNMVEIMSKCKNKSEVIRILKISSDTFYKIWNKAEKLLLEEI